MWRALVAGLVAVAALTAGCGGGGHPAVPSPDPPAPAPPATTSTPAPASQEPSLAVGITELNPLIVAAPGSRDVPAALARARDKLAAIRPSYYRLVLDWAKLQPDPGQPPDLAIPQTGCMRDQPPCVPWNGVRDQLRALASRQRQGGWQGIVTITDTPAWAAGTNAGCREGTEGTFGAPVRADALPAYRELVTSVLAAARQEGATLRYWSPWNEPNLAFFLSPQRATCDPGSPSLAAQAYVPIADALRQALDAAPGDQELALGELAAATEPTAKRTSVSEFIAGLPQDLVCSAAVWSQHAYVGGADPVDAVSAALRTRHCPTTPPIWITETGVGAVDSPLALARGIDSEQDGCRRLHEQLVAWWRDPRVAAAFQYTFREDNLFRVGLVSTDLADPRPVLREWQAWGQRDDPSAPPPRAAC